MGDIISEISNPEHWAETTKRMLSKDNLTQEQKMEVILLDQLGYRKEFIKSLKYGTYQWSIPSKQRISKIGTKRKRVVYIYSIKDRYVLGVLYRAFSSYFSKEVSDNCYSYKRGVRTLSAIDYLRGDIDLTKKFGVKLDISSYFNSVNREYLDHVLSSISDGSSEVEVLLRSLLCDDTVDDRGNIIQEYKSLTPGTAFASFLANYCLMDLDKYIAEELGLTYARYSDDILFFDYTEAGVQAGLDKVKIKLEQLGLKINETKYEWVQPGGEIEYLGLKLRVDKKVDISENSKRKFKKKIKHACVMGRKRIEVRGEEPEKVAKDILGRFNYRVYKCFIQDASKFGWAYYAFRYIDTVETLREMDFYLKDRVRQMVTGKNNSANIRKVSDSKLAELGFVSLVEMYIYFRRDFDYYCDAVDLLKG